MYLQFFFFLKNCARLIVFNFTWSDFFSVEAVQKNEIIMTEKIADRKSWDVFSHRDPTHLELIWIEFNQLSNYSRFFRGQPNLGIKLTITRSLKPKTLALLAQKSHFRFIAADQYQQNWPSKTNVAAHRKRFLGFKHQQNEVHWLVFSVFLHFPWSLES